MKAPNGETAYDLTPQMLEALHAAIEAEPNAIVINNIRTAVALLNRRFIQKATAMEQLNSNTTYYITQAGRRAYGIARRAAGVM